VFVYGLVQKEYQVPFYEAHHGRGSSINEVARNSLVIMQGAFGIDLLRDLPPNVKFVGSLLTQEPQPLPQDYKEWMDDSPDGVVLASFGNIVRPTMEENIVLLQTFKLLSPMKVLWKLSKGHREGLPISLPPNVRIEEWLPQNDLIGHPSTKVFMTHCGMNSMMEGIYHAVPMFGFPKFADQFDNCKKIAHAGIGKTVHKTAYSSEKLAEMILEVATNSSYRERARIVKSIVDDAGGVNEAVKWIEYALKNGVEHLVPTYAFQPFWKRWLLDIIGFLTACVLVTLYIVKCLCSLCFCKRGPHTKKD